VYTDRLLLKRILRNLVVNALRYTSEGAVLIGCRRRGDSVVIQVVDTGQGIPKDQLDLIFEDFYQVGNLARARTHGLGIGLAVVSRLSRLLGHPVSVSSVVGKGSIFSIQLQSHGRAERVGVSLHEVALGDY
jgi:signal transduction histidine kinase